MSPTDSFLNILRDDVLAAIERHKILPTDVHRREVARSIFAAIEGAAWHYRTSVIDTAKTMGALLIEEEFALSEKTYSVSRSGKISEQPKFIPLLASFRLTEKIARRMSSNAAIDFESPEWSGLNEIIAVRHAVTHPKNRLDLEINELTIQAAVRSLEWLLQAIAVSLDEIIAELQSFFIESRAFLDRLKRGDPAALKLYAEIKKRLETDSA